MADQDDFEPGGRCWKKTRRAYLEGVTVDDAAFSVEHVLKHMIKVYGESPVLPQVLEALYHLAQTSDQRSLWHAQGSDGAFAAFEATIAQLEPLACDRRIDAVMLRTARSVAAEPGPYLQPAAFVAQVFSDVARHCCLDEARASSIGTMFSSDAVGRLQAHVHHQQVLDIYAQASTFWRASISAIPLDSTSAVAHISALVMSTRNASRKEGSYHAAHAINSPSNPTSPKVAYAAHAPTLARHIWSL